VDLAAATCQVDQAEDHIEKLETDLAKASETTEDLEGHACQIAQENIEVLCEKRKQQECMREREATACSKGDAAAEAQCSEAAQRAQQSMQVLLELLPQPLAPKERWLDAGASPAVSAGTTVTPKHSWDSANIKQRRKHTRKGHW